MRGGPASAGSWPACADDPARRPSPSRSRADPSTRRRCSRPCGRCCGGGSARRHRQRSAARSRSARRGGRSPRTFSRDRPSAPTRAYVAGARARRPAAPRARAAAAGRTSAAGAAAGRRAPFRHCSRTRGRHRRAVGSAHRATHRARPGPTGSPGVVSTLDRSLARCSPGTQEGCAAWPGSCVEFAALAARVGAHRGLQHSRAVAVAAAAVGGRSDVRRLRAHPRR